MNNLTIEQKKQLVSPYASKYQLDLALVCAVVEQESNWDNYAYRFEPAFKARYIDILNLTPTESIGRSISFGLMQVMGEVARELGFTGTFLSELCDPEIGLEYGCKKLARCFETLPNSVAGAALLRYNGGSNPDYPKQVLARIGKYQ